MESAGQGKADFVSASRIRHRLQEIRILYPPTQWMVRNCCLCSFIKIVFISHFTYALHLPISRGFKRLYQSGPGKFVHIAIITSLWHRATSRNSSSRFGLVLSRVLPPRDSSIDDSGSATATVAREGDALSRRRTEFLPHQRGLSFASADTIAI